MSTENPTQSDAKIVLKGPAFTALREQAAWLYFKSVQAAREYESGTGEEAESWKFVEKLFGKIASHLDSIVKSAEKKK